jgi:uncharacterized membrane protein YidH (DUF202 family)
MSVLASKKERIEIILVRLRFLFSTPLASPFADHTSALERTFLGYLRTSLILVMTGILTAQLFHLQHSSTPNPHFGFYKVGKPLAATFICMAIVVVLIGAIRFWRLQRALVRGKAMAGGWEVGLVMVLMGLLLLGTFGVVVGVDIEKARWG